MVSRLVPGENVSALGLLDTGGFGPRRRRRARPGGIDDDAVLAAEAGSRATASEMTGILSGGGGGWSIVKADWEPGCYDAGPSAR